ncbi:hypothetical protein Tco_1311053 [Tanacetum coccineum]
MDEEFTTTAYPKVQENLKLSTEDQVILEEPTSSTGTLSSLQHLEKELSFTDQFFMKKPQEEEPEKTNAVSKVQSMVTVPIHQDTSSVPLMTTSVINITTSQPDSLTALQALLRARFKDLPKADMKETLLQRMWETGSYKTYEDHKNLYEALEKSIDHDHSDQLQADLAKARNKHKKRPDSPRTPSGSPPPKPPPPPPPAGASSALGTSGASRSSQFPQLPHPPSTNTNQGNQQQGSEALMETTPKEERPTTPKPAWTIPSSNVSDVENNWASALVLTYEPPAENSLLAKTRDMMTFMNWYCQKVNKTVLTQAYFEGQAYEVVKAFYPDVVHLQFQMDECHKMLTDQIDRANPESDQFKIDVSRPLPLSGPPGHLNLTKPRWDANGFEYKHDYTIIDLPRAVVVPVSNNEWKITRFNEIYKFSNGTLTNIMEVLDYRVKKYKVNRLNPGMNTRFWTVKDVEMSKLGDSDVHTWEDLTLILEILLRRFFLRLNLPNHKSILTGSEGSSKDGDGDTSFQ